MRKFLIITGLTLTLGNTLVAEELDEIKLVDHSSDSPLYRKAPIIGCSDHAKKKEESCSKKPEEIILSKLPTSQQLDDEKESPKEESVETIKDQLSNILGELSRLKREQQADRNTIRELRKLINILSNKNDNNIKNKITLVQKGIKKITPKKRTSTITRIKKPIKEISRDETHAVIEVQSNESLSTYAQYYYNDNTKYYRIYKANRDKINKDLQIIIGDQLIIPLP
jgi:hypothetical protein